MRFAGGVIDQVQAPLCCAVGERCLALRHEAKTGIELTNYSIFRRRNVLRTKHSNRATTSFLDCDIHHFKLELAAEHTAAHHPTVDVKHVWLRKVGAKNHDAHNPAVAEPIDEPKL